MSLCNVLNSLIKEALLSEELGHRYSFENQIYNFIKNNTEDARHKDVWGYCSPLRLIQLLIESDNRKLPIYGYNGDVKSLHKETQILLKLGFVKIIDGSYLRLDTELGINIDRIRIKEGYRSAILSYKEMLSKIE